MQQKIIIIGDDEIGATAHAYLRSQGNMNIEIISDQTALKMGLDATYFKNEERAVSAIEIVKQFEVRQFEGRQLTRRERRIRQRKSKKQ